jgi:hypothetical protein
VHTIVQRIRNECVAFYRCDRLNDKKHDWLSRNGVIKMLSGDNDTKTCLRENFRFSTKPCCLEICHYEIARSEVEDYLGKKKFEWNSMRSFYDSSLEKTKY